MELGQVIGSNATRMRGTRPMDEIAEAARKLGMKWDSSSIAKIERGQYKSTVQLVVVLAGSLGCSVADLLVTDQPIELTSTLTLTSEELLSALERDGKLPALAGFAAHLRGTYQGVEAGRPLPPALVVATQLLDGDRRMARALGIDLRTFAIICTTLWGRPFTAERDLRAGPNATPQKRGRVARDLKIELLEAVSNGDD